MADPSLIGTSVKVGSEFKAASTVSPVLSIHVKPDAISTILGKLDTLKEYTKDSEIIQAGNKYSFIDKRNNQPLAELDTSTRTLAMYKSPPDMAARINNFWISTGAIEDFITKSKAPDAVVSNAPAPAMQLAANK